MVPSQKFYRFLNYVNQSLQVERLVKLRFRHLAFQKTFVVCECIDQQHRFSIKSGNVESFRQDNAIISMFKSSMELNLYYFSLYALPLLIYIQVKNATIFHWVDNINKNGNCTVSRAYLCGARGPRCELKTLPVLFSKKVRTCGSCERIGEKSKPEKTFACATVTSK